VPNRRVDIWGRVFWAHTDICVMSRALNLPAGEPIIRHITARVTELHRQLTAERNALDTSAADAEDGLQDRKAERKQPVAGAVPAPASASAVPLTASAAAPASPSPSAGSAANSAAVPAAANSNPSAAANPSPSPAAAAAVYHVM
jgi:hypothetical protein